MGRRYRHPARQVIHRRAVTTSTAKAAAQRAQHVAARQAQVQQHQIIVLGGQREAAPPS